VHGGGGVCSFCIAYGAHIADICMWRTAKQKEASLLYKQWREEEENVNYSVSVGEGGCSGASYTLYTFCGRGGGGGEEQCTALPLSLSHIWEGGEGKSLLENSYMW